MSILIKGMDMPTNMGAMITIWPDGQVDKMANSFGGKTEQFRAVEVPVPHGRLIDADAETKRWGLDKATKYGNETAEQQHFSYSTMMMYEIADILDDATTVIESEE